MKILLGLFIILFSFKASELSGQIPFFQQYHLLKKSEPVQVNTLLQDRTGFIWFGTNKGLFRFDGVDYKHYADADSLSDSNVTALAQDSLGRIWLGHQSGALSILEKGVIKPFETREGTAVEQISDILFDSKGVMWFSTLNDGLYYYTRDRVYRLDDLEGLPDLFIYDLFEDPQGDIWAGTDGGVAICSLKDRKVNIKVLNADNGLPDIIIKKIMLLDKDTIGLATEDAGIINYNFKTGKWRAMVQPAWKFGSISDFVTKENQVWISASRRGLVVYDRQTRETKLYSQYETQSFLSVNALLKDDQGNIWSGSKTSVSRTSGDAVEHIEKLDPAKDLNILALAIEGNNGVWFSTSEGLFVRTTDSEGMARVERQLERTPFKDATVISLFVDEKGHIWAGLYGNGLLRIDPLTRQVKHFKKELRNGNILSITGKGDQIWLATLGGSTSIVFKDGAYTVTNFGSADGLSSDFIYNVFIDSHDRTWFATDGKGVSMRDENGFHHYEEGLASKVIYGFAEDANKRIWVASQDNGIYLFDEGKFVMVKEVVLRDNAIQSLISDQQGNIVAIHNFGIDVYDVERKQMRYWGEETGIRDKHPNLNAVTKDANGSLYIGTTSGIVRFSLRNDQTISIPRPSISGVGIHGRLIDISSSPQLKHSQNNVTVHYLGFWYQNANALNYLYKLENYDLEWISTRNQDVTYSQLPPGDYVFRVKASETEDFSRAPESTLAFSISPPFWQTGAFYFFIVGLIVISGYGIMKFRERRLIRDKFMLEAKVEERTKEIQQKTEEIQAQNEEIMAQAEEIQGINENLEMLVKQRTAELEKKNKALEEYAFINAHKLRSPVASILGLLNLLSKNDLKDDPKLIRQHLQNSADKLDEVVRSITKAIEKAE